MQFNEARFQPIPAQAHDRPMAQPQMNGNLRMSDNVS
jgi:hypothetical protein